MDNYHLYKEDGSWKLKKEHAERASKSFGNANKDEAIREAAKFLSGSGGSLKIHKEDGKIQEERTYPRSADPKSSKG